MDTAARLKKQVVLVSGSFSKPGTRIFLNVEVRVRNRGLDRAPLPLRPPEGQGRKKLTGDDARNNSHRCMRVIFSGLTFLCVMSRMAVAK